MLAVSILQIVVIMTPYLPLSKASFGVTVYPLLQAREFIIHSVIYSIILIHTHHDIVIFYYCRVIISHYTSDFKCSENGTSIKLER